MSRERMRLAVLEGPRRLGVVEDAVPEVAPDEVLLRVANCGVCTSELDMWEGHGDVSFPRYVGHEVSGTVEAVGTDVRGLRPGDPVAAWVTERGFAEYVAVKGEFCVPVDGVPLELALGEPLACAVNTVELANVSLGDDVVLIGAGFMGNLVQKLVELRGPRHLIVADLRTDALERARELGATHAVDVSRQSLPDAVRELTDGRGADVTFEVTGAQPALDLLGDVTRMSGTLVLVGYHQGAPRTIPLGMWNWMAFDLVNAHFREVDTIMRGMRIGARLLTSGRLSLDGFVSHRFALPEIDRAFAVAHEKPEGFVKATVAVDDAG